MPIPNRTSITLGLRVIPPSAGLNPIKPVNKSIRHHVRYPNLLLKVVRDEELEKEIADWLKE